MKSGTPVGLDQQQAQRHRRPRAAREEVANGQEVAEGLRHLLALDKNHAVRHSVAHEAIVWEGPARLGGLILVLGEKKIGAPPARSSPTRGRGARPRRSITATRRASTMAA